MNTTRAPALIATSLILTLAACASSAPRATNRTNPQLAQYAEVLEQNTRALAERADAVNQIFSADAHALQRHAYDLRMATASGRSSDSELRSDFDQVTRSYQALRTDAQQLNTEQANGDLALVSHAYDDVAMQMGGAGSGASAGS